MKNTFHPSQMNDTMKMLQEYSPRKDDDYLREYGSQQKRNEEKRDSMIKLMACQNVEEDRIPSPIKSKPPAPVLKMEKSQTEGFNSLAEKAEKVQ
jgi:hypothetical protein